MVSDGCSSRTCDTSGSLAVASRPTQAGAAFGTARFPILPWVGILNLGSPNPAIVRCRLPGDLTERCNITPVLIETFVETPRDTDAVYGASGSPHVGTTQRRGR